MAVILFAWIGWAHWGFGVIGDHSLDLADALRLSQGDIPYRDFLPTYGALHMFLVAPFFRLGQQSLPLIWCVTSLLIFIQLMLIFKLGESRLSRGWSWALLALAIAAVAYAPTNSKFILGFSQSGFLATFLLTLTLFILQRGPSSPRHSLAAGVILGLTPFTKIDLGITATLLALVLVLIRLKRAPRPALCLAAGFLLAWLGSCLFLIWYGAEIPLLIGSTLESFGQVNIFLDRTLAFRLKTVAASALLIIVLLSLNHSRRWFLPLLKRVRPCAAFLLPLLIGLDLYRGFWHDNPLKHLVMLNWLGAVVSALVFSHLAVAVIRHRSLRPLYCRRTGFLVPLLVIAGMGMVRVFGSGWYPLNYFQPSVLLLTIFWAARQHQNTAPWARACLKPLLAIGLLLQLVISFQHAGGPVTPMAWIRTPFGMIRSPLSERTNQRIIRLLGQIHPASSSESLLCTYEPSFQILTGMRSAAFYTYFNRLSRSGKYQEARERQTLRLLRERRPAYVLQDGEGGKVHQRFGLQYGRTIADEIAANYVIVDEMDGTILYRRKADH